MARKTGWMNVEFKAEDAPTVERNPYDGTYLISWEKPGHNVGVVLTQAQLEEFVRKTAEIIAIADFEAVASAYWQATEGTPPTE